MRAGALVGGGVALVALGLCVGLSLATHGNTRRIERRLARIEAWLTTPVLDDVEVARLGGQDVKLRAYALAFADAHDVLTAGAGDGVPYPTFHVPPPGPGAVPFHPYQWSCNLVALVAERDALRAEIARADPFVEARDDGDWYPYPFAMTVGDRGFRAPWYSAFGQAWVVAAFVRAHRASGDPSHLERARRALRPLLAPRRAGDARWVTFVDEGGFLWFEEYAGGDGPEPRVLNGHVQALMGIYAFHCLAPDDATLVALRAGITTVQRYAGSFRRPGTDPRYGLGLGDLRDYGPARAVAQQAWLHAVTGEPFFAEMRRTLASDVGMGGR